MIGGPWAVEAFMVCAELVDLRGALRLAGDARGRRAAARTLPAVAVGGNPAPDGPE
jgi:hypothetical protein